MIELTLCDGNPITVNPAALASFQPADENTLLVFTCGRTETVQESYDAVAEVFNPERQASEAPDEIDEVQPL